MKVYFVGPPGGSMSLYEQQMKGQRVLYSYATCRYMDVPEGAAGYCLDSGAFTVWKKGKTINMNKLIEWYERHDTADFKLMLDVIGGSEQQQKHNLNLMEREGQDVVPVFHGPGAESWEWFDELCKRYPLVAIGSLLPDNTSAAATEWLKDIFDRVCDPSTGLPKYRIHGLRMTSRMGDFPFASVDGSAWVTAAKNGRLPVRGGGQTDAPIGFGRAELQDMWIRAWTHAPKCETYFPRKEGKQLFMFKEAR